MYTILMLNQKGGVGKTTIADELSFALERRGKTVAFVTTDPQGGSVHEVCDDPDFAEECDFQVVDTAGVLVGGVNDWCRAANLILVPMLPSTRDMEPTLRTLDIVRESGTGAKAYVIVNNFYAYGTLDLDTGELTRCIFCGLCRHGIGEVAVPADVADPLLHLIVQDVVEYLRVVPCSIVCLTLRVEELAVTDLFLEERRVDDAHLHERIRTELVVKAGDGGEHGFLLLIAHRVVTGDYRFSNMPRSPFLDFFHAAHFHAVNSAPVSSSGVYGSQPFFRYRSKSKEFLCKRFQLRLSTI